MSPALSLTSTVVVSPEQVSTNLEGEVMILGMRAARYYSLDPIGCRIWSLLQQPTPVADVCRQLLAEYDVEPERCQTEVLQLLGELSQEGLIETRAA